MSLFITSLNSGSNGNCYYIGNDHEAVLVDAGISCRETERRMKMLGLSMTKVKAVFISHEHSDHIKAVERISGKYSLPVYITKRTLQNGGLSLKKQFVNNFTAYEPVMIGKLSVTAFPKFHDAIDPHSFIIRFNGINVGVFTDIGASCEHVVKHFAECHAAFLETNYDEMMLEKGRYPIYLKNRIRGGQGHLSNAQALDIFKSHRSPNLTHLFLSHLSQDNNKPELVQELFNKHAGKTNIIIASRHEATSIYRIDHSHKGKTKRQIFVTLRPEQLSLFS